MPHLLGIDLGTSSVKAVIIDESARVLGVGNSEYPILTPQPGHAEQNPDDWWRATAQAVRQATQAAGDPAIAGIGLCGQMHGPVLIDAALEPLGAAIIWPDQRCVAEVAEIAALPFGQIAGTAPATGFMAPTLLWLRRHDPARLDRARAALLPKDYLRLRLTESIGSEASDASATALFDIARRTWSDEIVKALDLPGHLLPPISDSAAVVGEVIESAAASLGLQAGIPVVAGCADQAAQAVGNALIDPGVGSVTLGTGGQLFMSLAAPQVDPGLRLHTFCHAPAQRWYLLGAMLAAGLSLRWLRDTLGMKGDPDAYPKLAALAAEVPPGSEGLLFLPYLVGERAPLMDPLARGCFVGLTLRHGPGHLARAIMEGVAFAMRQILEVMDSAATRSPGAALLASGNGLGSPVWRQIAADIFNRPLRQTPGGERSGVGAALLAGIGIGVYNDYADLSRVIALPSAQTEPQYACRAVYDAQYGRFMQLYPLLRPIMHDAERF